MGVFDFLWATPPQPFTEAGGLPEKLDFPYIEPAGTPTNMDALDKVDRRNGSAIVAAALRDSFITTRPARYADFGLMDKGDIAAALDAVVAAALTFDDARAKQGFKVECDDPAADQILQLALVRTKLQDKVFAIARDLCKFGDQFTEPIYAGRDIVAVQTYRPLEMYRSQDDKGKLTTQKDDDGNWAAFQQKRSGKVLAGWRPWEMIHFKYYLDDRSAYSVKGMLDDLRDDWRKLEMVEFGMVGARVTRAYPRRVHYVDLTGKQPNEQRAALGEYINRMTRRAFGVKPTDTSSRLPTGTDVSEDLYVGTGHIILPNGTAVPRRNEIKTEDPAMAGLAELGDVTYLRQKVFSTVPADVVGIRRNTTGDLDSQDLAYARMLRRIQRQLEIGIRDIMTQQLLAYGKVGVSFQIVFPSVIVGAAWKHADARFKDSLTLRNYLEMGAISRRFAIKRSFGMSDAEVDDLFEEILAEATSPVFQPILPFRNGQPVGLATQADLNAPNTPSSDVGGAKGKAGRDSLPSAKTGVAAAAAAAGAGGAAATLQALDPQKAKAVTNSGIYRGTNLGKRLSGNRGG